MRKILNQLALLVAAIVVMTASTSCVHEWPKPIPTRGVTLTVHHELDWGVKEFNSGIGRGTRVDDNTLAVRYIYRVYPAGTQQMPVAEITDYRDDLTLADFTTVLDIPVGEYDVWVWTDYVDKNAKTGLFYDANSFKNIKYTSPYVGDTMRKDAFAGMFTVKVPESIDETVTIDAEVTVKRPLSGYAFVSSDLSEFVKGEIARRKLKVEDKTKGDPSLEDFDFSQYKVKFVYPAYLPCTYDIFRGKPTDAAVGVTYEGEIRVLDEKRAVIGFDIFFINGQSSSVRVALEIYDAEGNKVAGVSQIDVPIELSKITIVNGNFLTTNANGGIGINPGFNGSFNIEI